MTADLLALNMEDVHRNCNFVLQTLNYLAILSGESMTDS